MKSTELVKYRKQHKLSQYDLAKVMGVSRGSVAHWEQSGELPERATLWLEKRLKEEELKTQKVGPIPKPGAKPFPIGRTGFIAQEIIPNSSFIGVKGVTDEEFYPLRSNTDVPVLNKDNAQLAAAVKEVVEKSLFDQKMDALQLNERIDIFIEELRKVVVDTVKRILGV